MTKVSSYQRALKTAQWMMDGLPKEMQIDIGHLRDLVQCLRQMTSK